jgi:anti-anti-sigma factor
MTTPCSHNFPIANLGGRAPSGQSASPQARQPAVVTLPAEIDVANASQVHDALTRAGESGTAIVVADATETTFCDCAGIRMLVRAHRQTAAAGTNLRVASATSPKVRRILELTGADQILDTHPSLAAALGAPPASRRFSPAAASTSAALCEHDIAAEPEGEWCDA